MIKQGVIQDALFFFGLICLQFGINRLFALNAWNSYTISIYLSVGFLSLFALPYLRTIKSKDAKLFVQAFLTYTVLQMLVLMTLLLIVMTKYPKDLRNVSFQLLPVFVASIIFQSVFLSKKTPK